MRFIELVLSVWLVSGVGTAIFGLIWTCRKSAEMLGVQTTK
jgi:hypothetical protein